MGLIKSKETTTETFEKNLSHYDQTIRKLKLKIIEKERQKNQTHTYIHFYGFSALVLLMACIGLYGTEGFIYFIFGFKLPSNLKKYLIFKKLNSQTGFWIQTGVAFVFGIFTYVPCLEHFI
jgi:predicted nucleic acid-binding Zn ribbon protein